MSELSVDSQHGVVCELVWDRLDDWIFPKISEK